MEITTALFYVFAAVLLAASFRVITARSTVHSALFLILAFFNASCIWMLLKAEFLAIALVLVYIGAVMVLFLFVVMMLDITSDSSTNIREGFWKHLPLALFIGAFIALEMAVILMGGFRLTDAPELSEAAVKLATPRRSAWRSTPVPVPAGSGGRAAAGGDDRRHRADAACPQGFAQPGCSARSA